LASSEPMAIGNYNPIEWEGGNPSDNVNVSFVISDADYLGTFGIELLSGRNFDKTIQSDESNFIINETAAKMIGIENPIGLPVRFMGNSGSIIGVVRDYHIHRLDREISPLVISTNPNFYGYFTRFVFIKFRSDQLVAAIDTIRNCVNTYAPLEPFDYEFLEEKFQRDYQFESDLNALILFFTAIAVFLTCLGLFGLTAFVSQRRTKEIGIRKTLGATTPDLILILSTYSLKSVLISNLISIPVAYLVVQKWLDHYANRIDITMTPFFLAALVAFAITLLTIGGQILKSVNANPVKALRYE